jgi:type I restriction enzyme S subunit
MLKLEYKILSIGQVSETLEDKTKSGNEFPVLSSSMNGLFLQSDYFNRQSSSEDTIGYKKIPFGYFTYRSMSDTGEFTFNQQKILPIGLVSPAYPVFRINGLDESYFYYFVNKSNFFKRQLSDLKQGGTRYALPFSRFSELKIKSPKKEEQVKIGSFLSAIDRLIEKQKEKVDRIKSLKKCYLQKMFPARNELTPKLRFKGLKSNWQKLKITDLAIVFIGLVTTMTNHYSDKGTLLIRNSDIKENRFQFSNKPIHLEEKFASLNSSRKHKIGDVITVHTGDVGTSAVISNKEINSIGFATIVTRVNRNLLDSLFLSTYLNSHQHKQWAISVSTGDGRLNYNLGDYKRLVVPITDLQEQEKIGSFLSFIDRLIEKEESTIERYESLKKGYLLKIFAD